MPTTPSTTFFAASQHTWYTTAQFSIPRIPTVATQPRPHTSMVRRPLSHFLPTSPSRLVSTEIVKGVSVSPFVWLKDVQEHGSHWFSVIEQAAAPSAVGKPPRHYVRLRLGSFEAIAHRDGPRPKLEPDLSRVHQHHADMVSSSQHMCGSFSGCMAAPSPPFEIPRRPPVARRRRRRPIHPTRAARAG